MAFSFVMGDTYGGLNAAGEQADRNATNDWFRYAQMVQGLDAQEAAAQEQARQDAQRQAQWRWTMQGDLANRALANREQNLREQQFAFTRSKENPVAEKQREFDINQATDLADQGGINDVSHAAALFPSLKPNEHRILAERSKSYRKAAADLISGLQSDADTLNQAALPDADPEALRDAAAIRADKKRMANFRRGPDGKWVPAVEQPSWLPPVQPRGDETMAPTEMAALQADVPDTHRLARLRLALNPPPNLAAGPPPVTAAPVLPWTRPAGQPVVTVTTPKRLTPDIAKEFLIQAGGDKDAARALARQAGYSF